MPAGPVCGFGDGRLNWTGPSTFLGPHPGARTIAEGGFQPEIDQVQNRCGLGGWGGLRQPPSFDAVDEFRGHPKIKAKISAAPWPY